VLTYDQQFAAPASQGLSVGSKRGPFKFGILSSPQTTNRLIDCRKFRVDLDCVCNHNAVSNLEGVTFLYGLTREHALAKI
jgi:hypothetical protein